MTEARAHRYAIYYAPTALGTWWDAGSHWLGRCAARQYALRQPVIAGIEASQFQSLTSAPRRYGWHATLKAPFTLAANATPATLLEAVEQLASRQQSFDMPALQVARLGDFLALVPDARIVAIEELAQACVIDLHAFAESLSEVELQRRRKARLTAEEEALLLRWGYPHVLDHFRFHCSLTGPLSGLNAKTINAMQDAAQAYFGLLPSHRFDCISVFVEPLAGGDFALLQQFPLPS
jgi:hypothetical protein